MDWAAIANIFGERVDSPLALLDKAGRVRVFNRSMEQVLGWHRFEVEGQTWLSVCTPPDREADAKRWIGAALRGALRSYGVTALRKTGGSVLLQCEFSLIGRGPSQGLLMTVTQSVPQQTQHATAVAQDVDYEVSVANADFGVITRFCVNGEFVPVVSGAAPCHGLLYQLAQPCGDCPIREAADNPWPRTRVRQEVLESAAAVSPTYRITTAERIDVTLVRIRVRHVSESTLAAIHKAKMTKLAEQANLTPREREVLSYLLLGRNIDEMAGLAGISARTVKHHQANVLEKLGADSRADLMRLVF